MPRFGAMGVRAREVTVYAFRQCGDGLDIREGAPQLRNERSRIGKGGLDDYHLERVVVEEKKFSSVTGALRRQRHVSGLVEQMPQPEREAQIRIDNEKRGIPFPVNTSSGYGGDAAIAFRAGNPAAILRLP
jgi:hypothetical protein